MSWAAEKHIIVHVLTVFDPSKINRPNRPVLMVHDTRGIQLESCAKSSVYSKPTRKPILERGTQEETGASEKGDQGTKTNRVKF